MTTQQITKYTNSKTRIRRFSTIANAQSFLQGTQYANVTPLILGDDNKVWVCSTPRWAYRLIKAGYSVA